MTTDNPYIGRLVVLLSPVFGSVAVAIANWVQDAIGADLDETQLTVFLTGVFVAVSGIVYRWLANRGVWEIAQASGSLDDAAVQAKAAKRPKG